MRHTRTLSIGLGLLLVASGAARAVTVTNVAVADATLRVGTSNSNFGTTSPLSIGDYTSPHTAYRPVLQFDLSSIPSGMVLSATLRLQNVDNGVNNGQAYGYVHRLTNSWSETQATWNNRLNATPWLATGGDYDGSVTNGILWLRPYAQVGALVYEVNLTPLVQAWVNGTQTNHGLVIVSSTENLSNYRLFAFESRESAVTGAVLPSLVIVHDIPEPSALFLAASALGAASVRWRRKRS